MNNSKPTKPNALSRRRNETLRLILDALFTALYFVFAAFFSIRIPIAKFSLSSIPLLLAAYLFGPVDAVLVATVGSFLEQVKFGLGPTAPLWMLPAILLALVAGLLGKMIRHCAHNPRTYYNLLIPATVVAELLFTAVNTAMLYLDGYLMQYSVKALSLLLPTRLSNMGARTVVSCITIRLLLPRVQKMLPKRKNT